MDACPAVALCTVQAQVEGLPITIEATPHHLLIDASEVPDGSTIHKCAPPLRDAENKHALRAAVAKGNIDTIGSDHSPVPARHRRMDEGNFLTAWGGMSGIQYLLPATNTVARVHTSAAIATDSAPQHAITA